MALNVFINEQASSRLSYYYQEKYIKEYRGNKVEETEIWVEYYNSDDYKYHLSYLIETWKNDIIDNFDNLMEDILLINFFGDMTDWKKEVMIWKNNYDKTFEYICKCYDAGYFFTELNYQWMYDIFELNILGTILK